MKKIAIEIIASSAGSIEEQFNNTEIDYSKIKPKKLIGTEEVIQFIFDLAPEVISMLTVILEKRRAEKKRSTIIIDGIKYEYSTKEELEAIIKNHHNNQ